jgi:hypothetical protein
MWFVFGFFTLISFSIYFGYKRINAAWRGIKGSSGGISFQYKVLRSKYGITGLLIGIAGPVGYDYAFKKETSIDRFFKFIGLSNEHQIGNMEFDDLVYVVSDNLQLHRQVSSNTKIADAVIKIFKSDEKYSCKVKEIRNNSGRIWVRCKTNKSFDEGNVLDQSSEIAGLLNIIANEIEQIPQLSNSRWRDPFVIKAAIILALSTGLAINGLVHLMRLIWTNVPFTIDSNQLFIDSLYWGIGLIFSYIIISVMVLGRSARTHLVMIELLLIGTFGSVATSFAELRDINIELDESVAEEYQVKALDKRINRGRRKKYYYLYLSDWNKEEKWKKVKVSRGMYHAVSIGDDVVITQKRGYLNYRWVESLERKT